MIGSGSYSDVYKARRLSDNLIVALKEIHDNQSAIREIEALQILENSPNVITLLEYFWREDEDAVLVLEYLATDLHSVIEHAKKNWENGFSLGEVKRWMIQILHGVDACHSNSIIHRDLKPSNLLINESGILKLADFGQARILIGDTIQHEKDGPNKIWPLQLAENRSEIENTFGESSENQEERAISREEYIQELNDFKSTSIGVTNKEANFHDGDTSCLATCTTSELEDDPLKSSFSYDIESYGEAKAGALTSCVGTRWYKAPELLFGSTDYGLEIDLWSLGCIFVELLKMETLFRGNSDIDQHSRIVKVLGNLTEDIWLGCSNLPDYGIISFEKIERPLGIEGCLRNCSPNEVRLVKKLVCYNPACRATTIELLNDSYFREEPLPIAIDELRVPSTNSEQDERSPVEWIDYNGMGSDTDFEDSKSNGFNSL